MVERIRETLRQRGGLPESTHGDLKSWVGAPDHRAKERELRAADTDSQILESSPNRAREAAIREPSKTALGEVQNSTKVRATRADSLEGDEESDIAKNFGAAVESSRFAS